MSAIIPSSEKSVAINDDEDINSDVTDDEAKTESACMMFIFVEASKSLYLNFNLKYILVLYVLIFNNNILLNEYFLFY